MGLTRGGPVVARGSLAAWEREQRARLAVAEEDGERTRMQAELEQLRDDLAALRAERDSLERSLRAAQAILAGLRESRGYRLIRRLGRWESVERGMRRALK